MKVFKFGGASVKDSASIKNVASILKLDEADKKYIIISAIGKTTNALEDLVNSCFLGDGRALERLNDIRKKHESIINELGLSGNENFNNAFNNFFTSVEWEIEDSDWSNFDKKYDQIVSLGELVSTLIVSEYLKSIGLNNTWIDARDLIKTNSKYREGGIEWEQTELKVKASLENFNKSNIIITQGFIGCDDENYTTTLGREGSDYTASIIAYCINAESMTVWKDVPGVLNADPKWFDDTVLLEHLSYLDTIELAYYGATILHPKTIKPLQNKNIPLHVRSFIDPSKPGTVIDNNSQGLNIPSFIFKINQILITISPKDFSFIVEHNLSDIFKSFSEHGVKINSMQNSAISFSVCTDYDEKKILPLIESIRKRFKVLYNTGLELITIRYYDQQTIDRVMIDKKLLVEVKSRHTVQLVVMP
jgi:aspartate kinase